MHENGIIWSEQDGRNIDLRNVEIVKLQFDRENARGSALIKLDGIEIGVELPFLIGWLRAGEPYPPFPFPVFQHDPAKYPSREHPDLHEALKARLRFGLDNEEFGELQKALEIKLSAEQEIDEKCYDLACSNLDDAMRSPEAPHRPAARRVWSDRAGRGVELLNIEVAVVRFTPEQSCGGARIAMDEIDIECEVKFRVGWHAGGSDSERFGTYIPRAERHKLRRAIRDLIPDLMEEEFRKIIGAVEWHLMEQRDVKHVHIDGTISEMLRAVAPLEPSVGHDAITNRHAPRRR
jgi:hypothetical protein